MSSVIRRFLTAAAVTGVCSLAATAQGPGVAKVGGTAPPLNIPPVIGAVAEEPVKDLTPTALPHGLFDPLAGEGGHGPAGHGGGGHAAAACDACGHDDHEGGGLYGTAEYLLMRPRRGAFDYALLDPSRDLVPTGNLQTLNYDLRSGVRAGIGYRLKDSAWSAGFTYTFFRDSSDHLIGASPTGNIYPTLTRPGLVDNVGSASANASLEYNVFDLEVGRRVHVDDRFDMRLYGGVRFATIRQDFNATYDLRDANQSMVSTKSNLDGFGPLLGAEGTLKVWNGFFLYGRGSAALLSAKLVDPITETNNAGATTYAAVDYRTRRVVPVLGAGIGAGWQRRNVSIRAGYEITNWFNAIDQVRFTNDLAEGKLTTRQADLSLEGLFVQFAVQY